LPVHNFVTALQHVSLEALCTLSDRQNCPVALRFAVRLFTICRVKVVGSRGESRWPSFWLRHPKRFSGI